MGDLDYFMALVGLVILAWLLLSVVVSPLVGLLVGTGLGGPGGWKSFGLSLLPGCTLLLAVWLIETQGTIWNTPALATLLFVATLIWVAVFVWRYQLSVVKAIAGAVLVVPLSLLVAAVVGGTLIIVACMMASVWTTMP